MPKLFFIFLLFFALQFSTSSTVFADFSCGISVSPSTVIPETYNSFTFQINNTGSTEIGWVAITPDANFTLVGYNTDWIGELSGVTINFHGGSIAPGESKSFGVNATSGSTETNASWTVSASETYGGNLSGCGSASVTIQTPPAPEVTPTPDISNITLIVGATSATVAWNTNTSATGVVNYGTTSGYGSSATTAESTTHSASLSALTASTTYHYQIQSTNSGGTTSTSDDTFTTASAGTTTTTTTTVNSTVTKTETNTVTKIDKDSHAPIISVSTKFDKPFEIAPEIEGKATDDKAVIVAEYSIDDGQNWQPVDNLKSPGEKSSTFTFTPLIFDDGNYKIKVRAKDSSANIGASKTYDLVIDRLPPVVGASLFAVGPQILTPTTVGTIIALPGIKYSFAVSARGGPTEIELTASSNIASQETNSFALSKNPESGLWTTDLSFDKSGIYNLKAKSKDGADNITERKLTTVIVLEGGKINHLEKPIQNATVSAYYLEPTSQKFILWDSAPYSQTNPQQTNSQGEYNLFLPAGTYYLQVTSPTYRILKTNIFKIDQTLPINMNLSLEKAAYINLGFIQIPLPDLRQSQNEIKINLPELSSQNNNLENKEFPKFAITNGAQTFTDISLRGKPAIVTLLNTWSPQTPEQIKILEELTNESEIKVVVIVPQESASSVEIYKKRAGYKIEIIADPDGTLVNPLSLQTSPTHFFLDRKGQIKKQKTGVFTKEELLDYLIN